MTYRTFAAILFVASVPAYGGTIAVSMNTSAVAGSNIKVVFDITANTLNLNQLDIENFAAPGSTYGLPETTGGLVDGDLILLNNPAAFTSIQTGSFFNELIVNLAPVGKSVSFTLSYTGNAPSGGALPDEVAFYLLDSSYNALFPTADPLGTDTLITVDLTGASPTPNVYAPASQTSPGHVQITIPGGATSTPEAGSFQLVMMAGVLAGAFKLFVRRRFRW
jgi:hypothetical protein